MPPSNRDRVDKAFATLVEGVRPYVDRRMSRAHPAGGDWFDHWVATEGLNTDAHLDDPSVLLRVIISNWAEVFRRDLSGTARNVVFSLRNRRNDHAHRKPFQFDDTYRALDEIEQLLHAVDAPQADDIAANKAELMRARFEADAKKKANAEPLATGPVKGLPSWRGAEPHDDVRTGRYGLAEFAADLHAVRTGRGNAEYVDPVEFFRRTFITEGLAQLLIDAAKRVANVGGHPVVDLQTNFGGGKTHSMIALYHLFSGTPLADLPDDLHEVMVGSGVEEIPAVPRAVLVGTDLKPGQIDVKDDGTEVRTMWGELAWQLGGRAAYDLVAGSDRAATSPGDALDEVFSQVGPCMVLIDEWVAYARELYDAGPDIVGGSFDSHFTFAQALTEAAKRNPGVLLVVSIPASEAADGTEPIGSEIEVGGVGGREALVRLRKVIGRVGSSWRPASAEESFEIVRRRLFKPLDDEAIQARDTVIQAFGDYYRRQAAELPEEVRSPRYLEQMRRAYPIHPEVFERLYSDWSTLERFQRTRGVLRLMATVITELWESNDQSPLIMPASLPLDRSEVSQELLRNLEDSFAPVLDTDIDGDTATSRAIDREFPNLGKYQATRRVARAVFFGAAPTLKSANRGIEAQRVRLACALPGETIETYGDALKRLSDKASYLYVEGSRYWFDTRQSVVRQAQEQAAQFRNERRDEVHAHLVERLRTATRDRGEFAGVHVAPQSSDDVTDDDALRLVVLGPEHAFIEKSDTCGARESARELLDRRGSGARQRRNMLVFLAADQRSLEHLEQAAADYLAWERIANDPEAYSLDRAQERQAKERCNRAEDALIVRLAETYRWLLVPRQALEQGAGIELVEHKLDGSSGLAKRASERLQREGILYLQYPVVLLRSLLDGVLAPEWADGHVTVGRLWDVLTQYPYLPKLRDRSVLEATVSQGPASTTWQSEGFAVADLDAGDRYAGLSVGEIAPAVTTDTLIVRPDVALGQVETEHEETSASVSSVHRDDHTTTTADVVEDDSADRTRAPTRYQGAVRLDPVRAVKQFQTLADEILVNLQAVGQVEVTIEISATAPDGYDDRTVRNITENANVLRFEPGSGFEAD